MTFLHLWATTMVVLGTAEVGLFIFQGHNFLILLFALISYIGACVTLGGITDNERERSDPWKHLNPPM